MCASLWVWKPAGEMKVKGCECDRKVGTQHRQVLFWFVFFLFFLGGAPTWLSMSVHGGTRKMVNYA